MTTAVARRKKAPPSDPVTDYAQKVVAGEIVTGKLVRLACERHLRDLSNDRRLKFDDDAAQFAIDFFERLLCLTEGEFAGSPFLLEPFQKFIVGSLFGWKGSDGFRRFRTAYVETGKGNGKALALDTPIPTPGGWSTMGALQVGDQVFDETGRPCVVLATTDVMVGRPCYRLTFSDGETIVADADHLWRTAALRSGSARGPKPADAPRKGTYAIRTTAEIAASLKVNESTSLHPQAIWNHRVDLAVALELPDAELPVPPYTLGAWLGDGDSDCARLTMAYADAGIASEIVAEGVSVGYQAQHSERVARLVLGSSGRTQAARNESLQAKLRALGVLGNKHIPAAYLRASCHQRLMLLRGLLDTDGSISRSGRIEFCTTNPHLATGFRELLHSLGFKPMGGESDAMLNGRVVGRRWRITFTAYADQPVFLLERKARRQVPRPTTRPISEGRMIVGCEVIPSVPVRCISVSAPSEMYLAGEGMVPTHNSPLAAGIGLLGLIADREPGAEVYAAAVTRDQAKILFADAEKMGKASPSLAGKLDFTVNNIAYEAQQSFFRAISAEARALDGKRVHMALIDEIHEHPDAMVVDKMRAGTKNRRQALIFEITNSGYDRNSVCYQHHVYSQQVLEGIVDNDEWFAYVCGLDEGDDFRDEAVWLKANPGLDAILPRKYLREQVAEATGMPSKLNIVLRLNFCVWTEQAKRWLDMEAWDQCSDSVNPLALRDRDCWLGIDLASTTDLAAAALVFEPDTNGIIDVLMYYWLPEDGMRKRVQRDRVPYDVWARQQYVELTDGTVIDYEAIIQRVEQFQELGYNIREIAMDPWNATATATRLGSLGFTVAFIRQGYASLNEPAKELERRVMSHLIRHGGNPVLRWNAANVAVAQDPAGNIKPDKEKSTERIDGIAAIVNAMARMMVSVDEGEVGVFFVGGQR